MASRFLVFSFSPFSGLFWPGPFSPLFDYGFQCGAVSCCAFVRKRGFFQVLDEISPKLYCEKKGKKSIERGRNFRKTFESIVKNDISIPLDSCPRSRTSSNPPRGQATAAAPCASCGRRRRRPRSRSGPLPTRAGGRIRNKAFARWLRR